jgi:long-chain fatty acid transport protein
MLGATFQPLSHLTLGVAGYAPFGGRVQFDGAPEFAGSPYPGAADGVARWHGIDASTMSIYGTFGAAYRMGPVSIGASVNVIYTTLQLNRAQNLNVTNDLHGEGRGRLDVSGLNGSFALGVTVEALPSQLWLSLSYQAQPGLGPIELTGKLEVDSSVPKNDDSLVTDVSLHEALPDIWRLGARYRMREDLELRAEADLTHWSVMRTQCIAVRGLPCSVTPSGDAAADSGVVRNLRRYWRDTYALRTGVSYWPTSPLELFTGLGFESAAAPDATLDPVLADAPNVLIAFGGRMRVASHWHIAASYTYLQFLPRDNTGSSRLADPATAQITRGPDGGGYYTQWAGILNANVQASF